MRYYTVYKDDKIIAFGSSSQCTKKLGILKVSNRFIRSFQGQKLGLGIIMLSS